MHGAGKASFRNVVSEVIVSYPGGHFQEVVWRKVLKLINLGEREDAQ